MKLKFIVLCLMLNNISQATENVSSSTNWSGYVCMTDLTTPQTNSVEEVHGSWDIPNILKAPDHSFCSIWVGIDGFQGSTMEQIGTAHEVINGVQINYAWFSMFPNQSIKINNFKINTNDSISASVVYIGNKTFSLKITNNTTHEFRILPLKRSNNALRNSAEWIVEGNSNITLASFDSINFHKCKTKINNVLGSIGNILWQNNKIVMVLPENVLGSTENFYKNTAQAIPSTLNNTGEIFSVKKNQF